MVGDQAALGGEAETERFVTRALRRLGAPLDRQGASFVAPLAAVEPVVRERLEAEDLAHSVRVSFIQNPGRAVYVHRGHPLTAILAETLFERALAGGDPDPATLPRAGVWTTKAVAVATTVALLRIRHRLTTRRRGRSDTLLVEEAGAIAWRGVSSAAVCATGAEALALLDQPTEATPPEPVVRRLLEAAKARLIEQRTDLDKHAAERARVLGQGSRSRPSRGPRFGRQRGGSGDAGGCDRTLRPAAGRGLSMARRKTTRLAFDALMVEGALIAPDMIADIAALKATAQSEADYRIPPGLKLRDEIGRSWRIAEALSGTNSRRLELAALHMRRRKRLWTTCFARCSASQALRRWPHASGQPGLSRSEGRAEWPRTNRRRPCRGWT